MSTSHSTHKPVRYKSLDFKGLPNHRIGDDGSVWTRKVKYSCKIGEWRLVKLRKHSNGYLQFCLWKGGKQTTYFVHRLVLEAFVGPCPVGMQCRHFPDYHRSNNRLDNLRWGTPKENAADRTFHGHSSKGKPRKTKGPVFHGSEHPNAKLNEEKVLEIRRLYKSGKYKQQELGAMHGMSYRTISDVVRRRNWDHV